MLINKEYFIGELLIPNLGSVGNGCSQFVAQANEDLLVHFILKYEREFLIKLLGIDLYNDFMTGLNDPDILLKWENLKSVLANSKTHLSPIAGYVYYWFVRNRVTVTVSIGEVEGQANNATVVSPGDKMMSAWNSMVDDIKRIVVWLDHNPKEYPCFHPDFTADIFFKINTFGI